MRRVLLELVLFIVVGGMASGPAPSRAADPAPDMSDAEAQATDWLLLPFASYAPSTKIAGGIVAGYYRSGRPSSNLEFTLTVTQRRQLTARFESALYIALGEAF